jgi:hypothetical protein
LGGLAPKAIPDSVLDLRMMEEVEEDVGPEIGEELAPNGGDVVLVPLRVLLPFLAGRPDGVVVELLVDSMDGGVWTSGIARVCTNRNPGRRQIELR